MSQPFPKQHVDRFSPFAQLTRMSQEPSAYTITGPARSKVGPYKNTHTDRQTDHSTRDICSNRPHVMHCLQAMRPNDTRFSHRRDSESAEKNFWMNLKDEFNCKDSSEDEIEVVEDDVASGFLVDRVFGSQSYTARADDDHDKQIEVAKVDDEVTETTNSAYNGRLENTQLINSAQNHIILN